MIPKELHVNRIVETFIEEAGVLAAANPQEWTCIQEAAALWSLKFPGCKDKGVRDFIAFLFDRPDPIRVKGKNQERFRLRRVWLNSGKDFAVTLFWEWLCTQSGWFIWHDERGGHHEWLPPANLPKSQARGGWYVGKVITERFVERVTAA